MKEEEGTACSTPISPSKDRTDGCSPAESLGRETNTTEANGPHLGSVLVKEPQLPEKARVRGEAELCLKVGEWSEGINTRGTKIPSELASN